jgi:predicted nucleotidyltransferase/DNA-binding XRE family transcriptional regulator
LVDLIDKWLYHGGVSVDVSELIRDARHRAGLSQGEMARRAGVAQPVVSAYENGRREPGLSMLSKLIEATGHVVLIEIVPGPAGVRGLPDTPIGRRLRRHRRAILDVAARRGATNVRVFGSVARGEDSPSSDVDIMVDLDDKVGVVGLAGLERELSEILKRHVDVVPARDLKPGIEQRVAQDAIAL